MTWNRIGFGTWPLSGDKNGAMAYGKTDDNESKAALVTAFDVGINFYDTSDFYGYGHVENLMGEVFEGVRSEIVICTKGGMVSNDGQQNFSNKHLIDSLNGSLKRLKTDYVDVYMLHSPKPEVLKNQELFDLLVYFKKSGRILEYGVSLDSPKDGIQIINDYGIKIIEVNYNILDHRAVDNGLLYYCMENDVKVICRTPLAQGILSGKFAFTDDKTDRRQSWSPEKVQKNTEIYKRMLSLLHKNMNTDAQNCLRFCLSNKAVSVVIPGMKSPKEVTENVSVLYDPLLTDLEISLIQEEYKNLNL